MIPFFSGVSAETNYKQTISDNSVRYNSGSSEVGEKPDSSAKNMKDQNDNPNKNPALPSYKLAKLLHECETEKKVLTSQVEELKVQLQTAKTHIEDNKEKNSKLAAKLQAQRTETEHLHLQIKKIDRALQNARGYPDPSQQRGNRKNHIMALGRRSTAEMFSEPQDRLIKELDESREQFKDFLERRAHIELERLQELQKILSSMNILRDLEDLKAAYNVEREKTLALEKELEQIQKHLRQEDRFHAEKALADMFLIRELRAVIEEKQNNVPEMRPLPSAAEDSEALTLGQNTLKLQELSFKAIEGENGPLFDSQVSKVLPDAGASEEMPTRNKKPLTRNTLHRFLGWKRVKKNLTKPKSSGDNNSSLNIRN
ncbi:hypothetical protein ILYODFUR_003926 [Ilyodon furcidens]|uniref:Uncharacterized protein n=1 Tax=Ilyodon furcidens TaxID=33524 RepID=A0ABV0UF60_9TELE